MSSKQVVVTRAAHQAGELASLLEERGVVPLLYPSIGVLPPEDAAALDDGIQGAVRGEFDWIVATSVNTIVAVAARLDALGIARGEIGRARVAAVGRATADAVRSMFNTRVHAMPSEYDSRHLAKSMAPVRGTRVFLPQSDAAEPSLADALRRGGAAVFAVTAYRTVLGSGGVDLPRLLERGEVDAITFTSAATVENFLKRFTAEGGETARLRSVGIVCLGRGTTRSVEELGLGTAVIARENTLESLVEAVSEYLSGRG